MKGLILLFKFMTRLPIPVNPEFDSKELGKSMKLFPVVAEIAEISPPRPPPAARAPAAPEPARPIPLM